MAYKIMKNASLLLAAALLAGCALAPGPRFTKLDKVPSGEAELVVYRRVHLFAAGRSMPLSIDGNQVGELYNGSYWVQDVAPGYHTVKVTTGPLGEPAVKTVRLSPGERLFLKLYFPPGVLTNGFFAGIGLKTQGKALAVHELKSLSSAKPGR